MIQPVTEETSQPAETEAQTDPEIQMPAIEANGHEDTIQMPEQPAEEAPAETQSSSQAPSVEETDDRNLAVFLGAAAAVLILGSLAWFAFRRLTSGNRESSDG